MTIKTLTNLSIKDQVAVFNQAFADYVVKFKHTEESKTHRSKRARVEMDLSIGVFDDDTIVAFIFAAVGEQYGQKTIYNAGTGVIPAYRGKRLVKKMYDFALPIWKNQGITQTSLEVVVGNEYAIKAYESVGLKISHKLITLSGALPQTGIEEDLLLNKKQTPNWSLYESLQPFDYAWDFRKAGVQTQPELNQTYELRSANNQLLAFAIINNNGQIAQAGVQTLAQWPLLMNALGTQFETLKWVNIHESQKKLMTFLKSIGWKVVIEQFEMKDSLC